MTFIWNHYVNFHLLEFLGCTLRTQFFNQFSANIFWNCIRRVLYKKWGKNFSSNQFVTNIVPMTVSILLLSKSCSWFWPLDQLWQFLCQFMKNFKLTSILLQYFIRNILENIYMIYTSKLIFGFNFINKYFQWCTHLHTSSSSNDFSELSSNELIDCSSFLTYTFSRVSFGVA